MVLLSVTPVKSAAALAAPPPDHLAAPINPATTALGQATAHTLAYVALIICVILLLRRLSSVPQANSAFPAAAYVFQDTGR